MIDTCATRDEAPAATDYDVLVVGAGIGGMESALKLGDMGYKVLLVEKDASVGGKMILLSKVFPTLDCASCISTPKMASTIHHPNIEAMTYGRVDQIRTAADGTFTAKVTQKARFVDIDTCTGCQKCETACTVAVPDQFNADLVARRAAHITFPQAVPKKAVIDRAGSSPCSFACPAGIQAHGYVSLIRSGLDEEAYRLVLDATPLVGTLGRACYAPCEVDCTRGSLEGTLPIRRLKRFASDAHDASGADNGIERPEPNGKRVAIVGSGPTGLTAAWQLARLGYAVKIFEAAPVAGGFLRLGIPSYRLPEAVVERDIENVTDLGVEIVTGTTVTDPAGLKDEGFDAVLVATGTHRSTEPRRPGRGPPGRPRRHGLPAQGQAQPPDRDRRQARDRGRRRQRRHGRRADRPAPGRRLRDDRLSPLARRDAGPPRGGRRRREGGRRPSACWSPRPRSLGNAEGAVSGLRCVEMRLGEPDASGRRSAKPIPGSDVTIEADVIIAAIGMRPDTAAFGDRVADPQERAARLRRRDLPDRGPARVRRRRRGPRAHGHHPRRGGGSQGRPPGRRLAQRPRLRRLGHPAPRRGQGGGPGPPEGVHAFGADAGRHGAPVARPTDFHEVEAPLTEAEARRAAGRCIDCAVCSECNECVSACPVDGCIDLRATDQEREVRVGAVVVSTGFKLFPADLKPEYGYGVYKNVITGMQMDRLLAPTRPFNTILRPGDGKVPERIAYILCTGSRTRP